MSRGMRRHTRPADYISKSRQAEAMTWGRPGSRSFSFTGEFPDMMDAQPVEATSRRRNYMSGNHTGSYHAIRHDDTARMPAINRHGIQVLPAVAILAAIVICLGSVVLCQLGELDAIRTGIARKQVRVDELEVACGVTQWEIASQSNDVNILQEAVRMGLINAKGVSVHYLEAPSDAVITLGDQTAIQSLASIWGN